MHGVTYGKDKRAITIVVDGSLPPARKALIVEKELAHLRDGGRVLPRNAVGYLAGKLAEAREKASLTISSVIVPERKVAEGILVKSVSILWARIVDELEADWTKAYQNPAPRVGGADRGCFQQSRIRGRDPDAALRRPRTPRDCVQQRRRLRQDHRVRESLQARPSGEARRRESPAGRPQWRTERSKGIVATTSDFAPELTSDRFVKPYLPTRLELLNGVELQHWLAKLAKKR